MRVLSYHLESKSKEANIEQTTPDASSVAAPPTGTWCHVVNDLITRFLRKDVLQQAYYSVTYAQQRSRLDEVSFATRIAKETRNSCHAFSNGEVANLYIYDLRTVLRALVQDNVSQLSPKNRLTSMRHAILQPQSVRLFET